MWTVVYIAPNRHEAERIRQTLAREGLLVKLRTVRSTKGTDNGLVEVLVPEAEIDEALEVIEEL